MQERRAKVVSTLVGGVGMKMKKNKVDVINGRANFVDNHTVVVGSKKVTGKYFIIATGSRARIIPVSGFQEAVSNGNMITSTEALSLPEVPKSLTVIGGGVIGLEFAVLYAELGTKVTVLQNIDKILEMLDTDVSKEMTKIIKDKGIEIVINAQISKMDGKTIHYTLNGEEKSVTSDKTLLSVGRIPNIEVCEKIDVTLTDRKAIDIDDNCVTSIDNIYAIGDVVGKSMLAHTAYKHA